MIAGLTHLALAATLAGAASYSLGINKRGSFMPKVLHLQEFHHPRLSLAAASNTILRSVVNYCSLSANKHAIIIIIS